MRRIIGIAGLSLLVLTGCISKKKTGLVPVKRGFAMVIDLALTRKVRRHGSAVWVCAGTEILGVRRDRDIEQF